MTNQEIFDKVAKHLLTQNARSVSEVSGACQYRADNGRMCAVGCLIPDELYSKEIEGKRIMALDPVLDYLMKGAENGSTYHLLSELQSMHDSLDVFQWRNKLKYIAREYKLDSSAANEVSLD